jgi:Ufm1-specific protease 2
MWFGEARGADHDRLLLRGENVRVLRRHTQNPQSIHVVPSIRDVHWLQLATDNPKEAPERIKQLDKAAKQAQALGCRNPWACTVKLDDGRFVTIPAGEPESLLNNARFQLQQELGISQNEPILVQSNRVRRPQEEEEDYKIHERVPLPDRAENVCLVRGGYTYYHYGIEDRGWGCAYRSLQTLISWYKKQHLLPEAVGVPSISEIQQTLDEIDDRVHPLFGSQQWIGSVELSLYLGTLNIPARVIPLSSGRDIASMALELSRHFEHHGSPVMIGGGVKAYTILGICQVDREHRFLVLDPHCNSNDQGCVAWKKAQFFPKASFHNLCVPLRPKDWRSMYL